MCLAKTTSKRVEDSVRRTDAVPLTHELELKQAMLPLSLLPLSLLPAAFGYTILEPLCVFTAHVAAVGVVVRIAAAVIDQNAVGPFHLGLPAVFV